MNNRPPPGMMPRGCGAAGRGAAAALRVCLHHAYSTLNMLLLLLLLLLLLRSWCCDSVCGRCRGTTAGCAQCNQVELKATHQGLKLQRPAHQA
jgi:hypothetical protein